MRSVPPEVHRAKLDRFAASGWRAFAWVAGIVAAGAVVRSLGIA